MSLGQKTRVQEQFGPSAEAYVHSPGHAGGPDLDRLVAWGREIGAARVLDIATGGGHTALAFASFTPTVVATRPHRGHAPRRARPRGGTRHGVRPLQADGELRGHRDGGRRGSRERRGVRETRAIYGLQ